MNRIILLVLVLLTFFVMKLLFVTNVLRKKHIGKMYELKNIITVLRKKQEALLQKTEISNQFQKQYKSGMRKLSEEIIFLQKTIFELLSNK